MNQQQKKHLMQRIQDKRLVDDDHTPEPPSVTNARKIIRTFESKIGKRYSIRRKKLEAARATAKEAVLFGDADKALSIVQKFEREQF